MKIGRNHPACGTSENLAYRIFTHCQISFQKKRLIATIRKNNLQQTKLIYTISNLLERSPPRKNIMNF